MITAIYSKRKNGVHAHVIDKRVEIVGFDPDEEIDKDDFEEVPDLYSHGLIKLTIPTLELLQRHQNPFSIVLVRGPEGELMGTHYRMLSDFEEFHEDSQPIIVRKLHVLG